MSRTLLQQYGHALHRRRHVAAVASRKQYGPVRAHRGRRFICLLTASAKCVKTMRGLPFCVI